ncbi:PepSY domain-containing protein [Lichenihabitans psoromatis]|uniref:PepSY domain-containing protein n=1 Tax=Lichenihabitans psoromatis TaxID=2528642 RepID=UPI001035A6AA|nr:PepSY domain-containing protein [Lichenihabitans psoromatis]
MTSLVRIMGAALTLGVVGLPHVAQATETRLRTCLSAGETRETLQTMKLLPPYRAVEEAGRGMPGESVGIKLCRLNQQMVYDVTILRHDGHLVHMLVDATNGTLMPPRPGS